MRKRYDSGCISRRGGQKKRMGRTSLIVIVAAAILLASSLTAAAVVLFRSLVRGRGDAGVSDPGNDLTMTVTELVSGQAVTADSAAFVLRAPGDSVAFTVTLKNDTKTHLTHRHTVSVKSVTGASGTLSAGAVAAVKSAVLVYRDGVFVDTLAHLTEQGEGAIDALAFVPGGGTDTHTLSFVLHSDAEAFSGVSVKLGITDYAENADTRSYFFVTDSDDLAAAAADINSGLLRDADGALLTPTVVLAGDLTLTSDITLRNDCILDLRGRVLNLGGHALTVAAGETTITSSTPFTTGVGTPNGEIRLAGKTAALNIREVTSTDGTAVSPVYAALTSVESCDEARAVALLAERFDEILGEGLASGTTAQPFGSLSYYLSVADITATGCSFASGVLTAPADLAATQPASLAVGDTVLSFRVFGADGDAVLAALRAGALAHLEALSGLGERITSDLFLPTRISSLGVTITWSSGTPDAMSDDGTIRDTVTDGEAVTLYARVRINETVYTLTYRFTVSSIDNAMRFSNFLAALSPLTLKDVWMGDADTASDDFVKSHQFLPNTVTGSTYQYENAYISPDTSLTTTRFTWEGYQNIGLSGLTYSQDATYNYVSVYTNAAGEQAVLLNTPVFSTFAQINVSATFEGDDEVYDGVINIIIETGNYEQLLDGVFDFFEGKIAEIDIYKNLIRSRMENGIARQSGDFSLTSVYSISASSISAGKYSISFDTSASGGLFTATAVPLTLTYRGKECQAYTVLDDDEGYDNVVTGNGEYVKVTTDGGYYYVSATEAGATPDPDSEEVIDGTGLYLLPVTGRYDFTVDMSKASAVETAGAIDVTVRYTYKPLVKSTKTLYLTVPAVILPDSAGFSDYSVFSSVQYQMFRYLPAAERVNASEAFEVSGTTVVNHTMPYILRLDVERCNGTAGNWFDGEYQGENLTIAYGDKLDSLRFYVGPSTTSSAAAETRIYDFLRLLGWATGNTRLPAGAVLSGGNTYTVSYRDGSAYVTIPSGTEVTTTAPTAQTENGSYLYYDAGSGTSGKWVYYRLTGAGTYGVTYLSTTFSYTYNKKEYYLCDNGGTLSYTTTLGENCCFTLLTEQEIRDASVATDDLLVGTASATAAGTDYYLYCPSTGRYVAKQSGTGTGGTAISMTTALSSAASVQRNTSGQLCIRGTTTYVYMSVRQSWGNTSVSVLWSSSARGYATALHLSSAGEKAMAGTLSGPYMVYRPSGTGYLPVSETTGGGTAVAFTFGAGGASVYICTAPTSLSGVASLVSDGQVYLTPDELSVLKTYYCYATGADEATWNTLIAAVSTTAPGRVITDGVAFDAAVKALTSGASTYFKHTELMRWALNEQNFPTSAFWDSSYPIGNPPNGGALRYNYTYTTVSGVSYYFRQTGTNSLKSGYFNEDNTEYLTDREEVVLQAFWQNAGALSGFVSALTAYSVVPTYLSESAAGVLVASLYASLGYPKDFSADAVQVDGVLYPRVSTLDGSLGALAHFTTLTELYVVGATETSGSVTTALLPAFLSTDALSTFFSRLKSASFASQLTTLVLRNCAQGHVTFDLTGMERFVALTYLDLGMNFGITNVGELLNTDYRRLTYLDLTGVGQADRYKDFTLNIIANSHDMTLLWTPDSGLSADGSEASSARYTATLSSSALLACLKELAQLDSRYMQLLRYLYTEGGTSGTHEVIWQITEGNTMYPSPVTSAADMATLLARANEALGTAKQGNYYGLYIYYKGNDVNNEVGTFRCGRVYRIVWNADKTAFVYDDAAGGTRVCEELAPTEFILRPLSARKTGAIYYLTEAGSYYGANKFYTMTFDENGFYYLKTFGSATPLMGSDGSASALLNPAGTTGSSAYYRIKNGRLYITTGNDYSGTGGIESIEVTATVIIDGVSYERVFKVTVIG